MRQGVGLSTGESTEHVNSFLSRLAQTTRHMTLFGRVERLEEASAFWNVRKVMRMPKYLHDCHFKVSWSIMEFELP